MAKKADGSVDYVKGANIAGFLKVANSMLDMGVIYNSLNSNIPLALKWVLHSLFQYRISRLH